MKTVIFPRAEADIVRQFRYYLVDLDVPEVAIRFRLAVRETMQDLQLNPRMGKPLESKIAGLRSWPVKGFEVIRFYYRVTSDSLQFLRLLHGKQNVRRILSRESDTH